MDTVHTHTYVTHIYEYIFNPHTILKNAATTFSEGPNFLYFLKKLSALHALLHAKVSSISIILLPYAVVKPRIGPWPVWLTSLSVVRCTQRLPVRFPVEVREGGQLINVSISHRVRIQALPFATLRALGA